jgi:hypothetical protein
VILGVFHVSYPCFSGDQTKRGTWESKEKDFDHVNRVGQRGNLINGSIPNCQFSSDGNWQLGIEPLIRFSVLSRWDPDLLHAVLIGVFAIVLANVFEQLIIRHTTVTEREHPRLLEERWIVDRNLIAQDTVRS